MNDQETGRVRTASSGVRDTYYGRPVIKAPHWRWLVTFYFFFGAIAGGSYTIGTIANLFSRDPAVERMSRYLSLAAVLPCPILLVLDLGRPERALNMFRVIKLKSPMSLGSWALLGLSMTATVSAALQAVSVSPGSGSRAGSTPRGGDRRLAILDLHLRLHRHLARRDQCAALGTQLSINRSDIRCFGLLGYPGCSLDPSRFRKWRT